MNGEQLWNLINSKLGSAENEFQTMTGKWFKAYGENDILVVEGASEHLPSSDLSKPRKITKKDFLLVYSYYDRWINKENGIRHEVSQRSRNTAYIFALIDNFNIYQV